MKHLDLFSGIGGFSLAARWVWGEEHEPIFCEIDQFCQKVLKKHWPEAKIFTDIKELTYEQEWGTIDLITGGFPCQPYSHAGKQVGKNDDRALWPEMLRIIQTVKPKWIIGENVAGIENMGLEQICNDLETNGYIVETPLEIPACAIGANHERYRFWITAYSDSIRFLQSSRIGSEQYFNFLGENTWERQFEKWGFTKHSNGSTEYNFKSILCRIDDGLSVQMDRLKGLGNAIVPQVAQVIMQAIKEIDK